MLYLVFFVVLFLIIITNSIKKLTINYCGILIENYLYVNSVNIGDYIQSLAAMQFCNNQNIIYVERDSINLYRGKHVKLVMNAWWRISDMNFIPSNDIHPFYISYHLDNPQKITTEYVNYLKKYEPIGCRDIYTEHILSKFGIKSYFSGCLTLTLGKTYRNMHTEHTKIVYFSDCPLCIKYKQLIMNTITNLTNNSSYKIKYMKHNYNKNITHMNRFKIATFILRKYESAFLVLTSRLHASLPCVAMNTSVILVKERIDKRFSGLINMINYIIINTNKTDIKVLNKDNNIVNPDLYINYSAKLTKSIKDFFKN